VNLTKGGTDFCHYEGIVKESVRAFGELEKDGFLKGIGREEFIKKIAYYMNYVNYIHPFREWNGRAHKLFFEQLAAQAGYDLGMERWDGESHDITFKAAVHGQLEPMYYMLELSVVQKENPITKKKSIIERLDEVKNKETKYEARQL
jgi:cell filamentation protein